MHFALPIIAMVFLTACSQDASLHSVRCESGDSRADHVCEDGVWVRDCTGSHCAEDASFFVPDARAPTDAPTTPGRTTDAGGTVADVSAMPDAQMEDVSQPPVQDWWDPNWKHRVRVTIPAGRVSATLDDFPVMIVLDHQGVFSNARADAADLVAVDRDHRTVLAHEIESYEAFYRLVLWVRVPSIDPQAGASFWIYYGNPEAEATQSAADVWSNGYVAVWHMHTPSPPERVPDSTSQYDASPGSEGGPNAVPGRIAGGLLFDGYDDRLDVGPVPSDAWDALTLQAWVKRSPTDKDDERVVCKAESLDRNNDVFCLIVHDQKMKFRVVTDADAFEREPGPKFVSSGAWAHLAATWHGPSGRMRMWGNGELKDSRDDWAGDSLRNSGQHVVIGNVNAAADNDDEELGQYFTGALDEVRISRVERSEAWIRAEFDNQSAPTRFFVVGDQESLPAP